jgi:hypothetical protein
MKTQKVQHSDPVKRQIEDALNSGSQIQFEDMADENSSPLNQPVVEKSFDKDFNPQYSEANASELKSDASTNESDLENGGDEPDESGQQNANSFDAPEQEIKQGDIPDSVDEGVEIPLTHATMAADTFIGVADNVLEIGGGFFITIKKHADLVDMDEVVEVIESQNTRNVKRFRLDPEDKALLRPLLVVIIRKRAKVLTPEQQLAAAVISILIKKFRLAMQIRAENEILVERIREIVNGDSEPKDSSSSTEQTQNREAKTNATSATPNSNIGAHVLEVAD